MDLSKSNRTNLDTLYPLIREQLKSGGTVCFCPRGTSMLPMLRQGMDSVTLSPINGRLRKYDLPLYRRDDGKFVLHRIVEVGEDYSCVGDNQFVIETGVRQDQLIGVVSEFGRGERHISVSSPTYRLYCVAWHYSRPIRVRWRGLKSRLKRIIKKGK